MAARTVRRARSLPRWAARTRPIVTANADLDAASDGRDALRVWAAGQKCSAGSTVFVHDAVADDFLRRLVDKTTSSKSATRKRGRLRRPGDQRAPRRTASSAPPTRPRSRVASRPAASSSPAGSLTTATTSRRPIVADLPADHPLFTEELFLPLLAVQRFGDLATAIARRPTTCSYGLTAGIFARRGASSAVPRHASRPASSTPTARAARPPAPGPASRPSAAGRAPASRARAASARWYVPQFMREHSHTVMG